MLFSLFTLIWSIIYTIFSVPFLIFMPMNLRSYFSVIAVKVALFLLRIFDGVCYEVRGMNNIPNTACIVASAHQSPLETLILMTVFKNPVYIMKKELRFLPFLGFHFIILKMIFINRSSRTQALRTMIRFSKDRIQEKRDIIIFPQGTRVRVGDKVPYKQGVAVLYEKLSVPVVPVALNTGLFWSKGFFAKKKSGKAIIEILPAILPGLNKKELLETLELQIGNKNKELLSN